MTFVCGRTRPAYRFLHQGFRLLPLLLTLFFILAGASRTALAATFHVRSGESLQAALEAARGGDEIVLEAGATYVGPFTLPARRDDSSGLYVTIRSSALDRLAAGRRVTPADAPLMPKIVSPGNGQPALRTAPGAHHYRLEGLEFAPASASASLRDLVLLGDSGAAQDSVEEVPHHLRLDRCYLHAFPEQELVRGVALNSAETSVTRSHLSGFKSRTYDAQAVAGWNGPGPYLIEDNYLEASGECVNFGGSDPDIRGLIPSDIRITRNHLTRPVAWRGVWLVKNLLELKVGRRVRVTGNVMEHAWADGQAGYALMLTVRNQSGGAPWSTISDLEITNNVIRHAGGGVNILGRDDRGAGFESVPASRIRIRNNLFEDIDGGRWGGHGHLLLVTDAEGVVFEHNTAVNRTGCFLALGNPGAPGLLFRDNVVGKGEYGICGGGLTPGKGVLDALAPGYEFRGNVAAGAEPRSYPPGNFYPPSLKHVGFVDEAKGDYRLSAASPYRGKASDGNDLGCDFDALRAALGQAPG